MNRRKENYIWVWLHIGTNKKETVTRVKWYTDRGKEIAAKYNEGNL
jgi:hypothetical protein